VLTDDDPAEVTSTLLSNLTGAGSLSPAHCGTLSPRSTFKLYWDGWFTPFQLVFLNHPDIHMPRTLTHISAGITIFFACDIVLNFFTGYIDGDRTVFQKKLIIKHYLKGWFWIDLIATLPYELLFQTDGEKGATMARLGKNVKFFKVLRLLKFLRCMRLMKIVKNMGMVVRHAELLGPVRKLLKFMEVQTFLILLTHIHGCIWASLQSEWVWVPTMEMALHRYAHSFWWAYSSVTVGSLGVNSRSNEPALWLLEMIIASERLVLIYVCLKYVFFESLTRKLDAEYAAEQQEILSVLRQNNVSFATSALQHS